MTIPLNQRTSHYMHDKIRNQKRERGIMHHFPREREGSLTAKIPIIPVKIQHGLTITKLIPRL